MNLGNKIKELRLKQNLKQSELAEKAQISRVTLGNYERGTRVPHIINLKKIANALNVDVNELITPMYELEEALMNGSDNISELVNKVKKTTKEEVIHDFRKLIDSADWKKFKNVSDEDIYSVVMSIELYAYLQGLFDMQRKTNITPLPKKENQMWEEPGKEYLMPKASHDKEGNFTEEDYKHDDDLMNDEDLWK
ncbi:helix-turn-helix domain-containing protein [Clostridium perfringens]|uniref:helix-turn-helix domain-containing protein n=1 Tax=Clostridium perfringens TaxID=1502 RepID=UPI0010943908|nr:helix-turn-helix transcriptional regulator [Clostridium perfringens]TGY42494.1 XRE family transcriptional regulator [Clostridium perfringens]